MSEMNENVVEFAPDEVLARVVKREDGYHVIDRDGTEGPVCSKRTADGYIILTPNASNRKNINEKNAEAFFAANPDGCIELTYKASRKLGDAPKTIPNAKLISYLSEEDQAEYKAIIDRAIAAREADRKKPMTDLEKAQAKIEKLKAQIAKLEALENDTPSEE
jgi:hypothetical protein